MLKIQKNILATLAYFDMFDYPLTYSELFSFIGNEYRSPHFPEAVNDLLASGQLFLFDKFYSLKDDPMIAVRRNNGNKKAAWLMSKAREAGSFLARFPYVRGIGVSGSLSKNFADDSSDIDFFIITRKNRLWVARTIMHCFKKLTFLVNRQHYFCMNYYIDEQQLEIVEKNIYTAIEVKTLIPLQGDLIFERFYEANKWADKLLPNKCIRLFSAKSLRPHFLKSMVEIMLNNRFGNAIDNMLMKITASRWNKKTSVKKLNQRGIVMSMNASKHCAKPDPANFQQKLLEKYRNKLNRIFQGSGESLAQ